MPVHRARLQCDPALLPVLDLHAGLDRIIQRIGKQRAELDIRQGRSLLEIHLILARDPLFLRPLHLRIEDRIHHRVGTVDPCLRCELLIQPVQIFLRFLISAVSQKCLYHAQMVLHVMAHPAHSLLAALDLLIIGLLIPHGLKLHIRPHDLRHISAEITASHAGDQRGCARRPRKIRIPDRTFIDNDDDPDKRCKGDQRQDKPHPSGQHPDRSRHPFFYTAVDQIPDRQPQKMCYQVERILIPS